MQISQVSGLYADNVSVTKKANSATIKKQVDNKCFDTYMSVAMAKDDTYNCVGQVKTKNWLSDFNFADMKNNILQQVAEAFGFDIASNQYTTSDAIKDLQNYFDEKSEDILPTEQTTEETEALIPEYWNRENTAKRMFAILMAGYNEDMDKEEFTNKATEMVNTAYSESADIIGKDLPQLVMDTKATVLDALDQFASGLSADEIQFS